MQVSAGFHGIGHSFASGVEGQAQMVRGGHWPGQAATEVPFRIEVEGIGQQEGYPVAIRIILEVRIVGQIVAEQPFGHGCRRTHVDCRVVIPWGGCEARRGSEVIDRETAGGGLENIRSHHRRAARETRADQAEAECERLVSEIGKVVAERDMGQFVAEIERPVTEADDVGTQRDTGKAAAGRERELADTGHAIAQGDAHQAKAVGEGSRRRLRGRCW